MAVTQVEYSKKALALKKSTAALKDADALDDRDILLTRRETANYLRKSVPTLERWAREGYGPTPILCGRACLYRLRDLRAFVVAGAA